MNKKDVKSLADDVLPPLLRTAGLVNTDVEEGQDEEGEDSLFITLHFKPGARSTGGRVLPRAQVALREALEERGDLRFPHFNYDYPDDPAPFDEYEAYGLK